MELFAEYLNRTVDFLELIETSLQLGVFRIAAIYIYEVTFLLIIAQQKTLSVVARWVRFLWSDESAWSLPLSSGTKWMHIDNITIYDAVLDSLTLVIVS